MTKSTNFLNPLVFKFKETPTGKNIDYSLIEYDKASNLNVIKTTKQPAITILNMDTETVTKSKGEATDLDSNRLHSIIDTETGTYINAEESDSDTNKRSLRALIDTETYTEASIEVTDQDKY